MSMYKLKKIFDEYFDRLVMSVTYQSLCRNQRKYPLDSFLTLKNLNVLLEARVPNKF